MGTNDAERRNAARRLEDKAFSDLYTTFSTTYCRQCLNQWRTGAILLDENLNVLFATLDAKEIVKRNPKHLRVEASFAIADSSLSRKFERFIHDIDDKPGPLCLVLNESNISNHILLHCYRLPQPMQVDKNVARFLVKIRCFDGSEASNWTDFAAAFGLTQAELRLCRMLYEGFSLKECCAEWHITVGTARGQLHAILGKTNTKKQSELVRLIMLYMQT